MPKTLEKYIPQASVASVFQLITAHNIYLKIVNERVTRHGDYRKMPDGQHQITVNSNLNFPPVKMRKFFFVANPQLKVISSKY